MTRIAEARAALMAALEPVLPGRVGAYGSEVLPSIYLGVGVPGKRQVGASTIKVVSFAVTISYDGSNDAQIAGLDEVTAKVCDAVDATPNFRWTNAQPGIDRNADPAANRTRQYLLLTVEATIGVASLCAPEVVEAETPPPIVQRIA